MKKNTVKNNNNNKKKNTVKNNKKKDTVKSNKKDKNIKRTYNQNWLLCILIILAIIILLAVKFIFFNSVNLTCMNISNQKNEGYKIKNIYTISADNGIVSKVVIKEIITSKKSEILSDFKNQLNSQYEYNKKMYGGYSYEIITNNDKLLVDVTVDYNDINLELFIKDNEAMKKYTKNNKLTLEGVKKLYESTGAKCK